MVNSVNDLTFFSRYGATILDLYNNEPSEKIAALSQRMLNCSGSGGKVIIIDTG